MILLTSLIFIIIMFIIPGEIFVCYLSSAINSNIYFYEIALGIVVTFLPLFIANDLRRVKDINPSISLLSFKIKNNYILQSFFSFRLTSLIIKFSVLLVAILSTQVFFENYAPFVNKAFLPTNEITYVTFINVFIYLFIATIVDLVGTSYDEHYYIFNEQIDARMIKSHFSSEGVVTLSWLSLGLVIFVVTFFLTQQDYGNLYSFTFLLIAIVLALLGVEYRIPVNELVSRLKLAKIDLKEEGHEQGEVKNIQFSWRFNNQSMDIKLKVSELSYQEAGTPLDPHSENEDFASFSELGCTKEIKSCAMLLRRISINRGFDSMQEVLNIVEMIKSIPMAKNTTSTKINSPVVTIYNSDKAVSLNDRTILAASILHYLGYKVGLFVFTIDSGKELGLAYSTFGSSNSLRSDTINQFSISINNEFYYHLGTLPSEIEKDSRLMLQAADLILIAPTNTPFQKI